MQRMKAILQVLRVTLEIAPNVLSHIESSTTDEMTGQETKLASMQEQILEGLDKASGGDPAGQVEARATLAEMKSTIVRLTQLSRLDTNNKSTTISLTTAKTAGDQVTKCIEDLDKLFESEATAGNDRSSAAYGAARWWIVSVSLVSVVIVAFVAYLVTRSVTVPVMEVRSMAQLMANGDLRNRIHL
jgi:methyl-accepting chemotaxis protein